MYNEDYALAGLGELEKETTKFRNFLLQMYPSATKSQLHFIERISAFPKGVIEGLMENRLQLVDVEIFKFITAAGTSVDVFLEDDSMGKGVTNLANATIDAKRPMVVSSIQLLYANHATDALANFDPAEYPVALKRAEWKLRYDSTDVIDKHPVMGSFGDGVSALEGYRPGEYPLTSPKILLGQKIIELEIDTPVAFDGASNHAIFVGLKGTTVRAFSKS